MQSQTYDIPRKKTMGRRGKVAGLIAALFACVVLAWLFLHVAVVLSPGESAWNRMPASTRLAVEVHGTQGLLAAVEKDGSLDRLLARYAATRSSLLGDGPPLDGRLLRFFKWYRLLPQRVRALVTPETFLVGMAGERENSELFAFIGLPQWMRWFVPNGEEIHVTGESGGEPLYYFFADKWCVASQSLALIETLRDDTSGKQHSLGPGAESPGPSIAVAAFTGDPSVAAPTGPVDAPAGNPFLSGLPVLPSNVPAGDVSEGQGLWQALIQPLAGEWEIRVARIDGATEEAANEFARGGILLPPDLPDDLPGAAGDAVFAATMPFEPDGDPGRWLDKLVTSPPTPERDHPFLALGWLWARWGWLRHAGGDFMMWADDPAIGGADPDRPVLPTFSLGWTTAGDHHRARHDFSTSLRLFFDALLAPGGPPWREAARRSITVEEFARSEGIGGTVGLPAKLAYYARPSWFLSGAEDGGGGYGLLTTHPAGLDHGMKTGIINWDGFAANDRADPRQPFTVSGRWRISDGFRENLIDVAKEFVPLFAFTSGVSAARAMQFLSVLDGFAQAYPRGKATAGYRHADNSFAAKIVVLRRQ